MASSSQFQTDINPHRPKAKFTISRLGNSKAQLGLQKILHTILTVPAIKPAQEENPHEQSPAKAVCVCEVAPEKEEAAVEVDNLRRRWRNREYRRIGFLVEAMRLMSGRINNANEEQTEKSTAAVEEKGNEDDDVNLKRRSNKRLGSEELTGVREMEPVVRSKRGRTQVLPCRYRDSVVEPLTRVPRNRATPVKRRFK